MKTILLIFLLFAISSNAQVLKESKDKFKDVSSTSLQDNVEMIPEESVLTSLFQLNIYKTVTKNEATFSLLIYGESYYNIICLDNSKCIILYDDSTKLEIISSITKADYFSPDRYVSLLQFQVTQSELENLQKAKSIEMKVYCSNGYLQGKFSKKNLKKFQSGISMIIK